MDAHKNFAMGTVAVAPVPDVSGLALTLAAGEGALFPAPPFNVVACPPAVQPMDSNAEIIRVTAIVGDVLTITRAQESTTAKAILVGWTISHAVTAKIVTDIEEALMGLVAGSTARLLNGKLYLKNPAGGGTPWHEVSLFVVDGFPNLSISETGVA